ncbi:hypothetical protein AMTRI_Chr06g199950 [Amborella trichopoda]
MLIKLKTKRFSRSSSKLSLGENGGGGGGVIDWELRPGGMLVQKREKGEKNGECEMIRVKVSNGSNSHQISIQSNATFGEMKIILSLVTSMEPQSQRLLFKGKEREDQDFLHMVGVKDMDKVLLLEDPANKERKLQAMIRNQTMGNYGHTITA